MAKLCHLRDGIALGFEKITRVVDLKYEQILLGRHTVLLTEQAFEITLTDAAHPTKLLGADLSLEKLLADQIHRGTDLFGVLARCILLTLHLGKNAVNQRKALKIVPLLLTNPKRKGALEDLTDFFVIHHVHHKGTIGNRSIGIKENINALSQRDT